MNKKLLYTTFGLVAVGAISVAGLFTVPKFYAGEQKLPEVLMKTTSFTVDNSMNIERKNGVWSSKDDDFYPVDNQVVDILMGALSQATLSAKTCAEEPSGEPKLVMHGKKDILLYHDENDAENAGVSVLYNDKCHWLAGDFSIPSQPYLWFTQPLLPFSNQDIDEIYGADPDNFAFSELFFYQAARSDDFFEWDSRKIKIVLQNGIVADLTIYNQGHSYWMSVNLGLTVMPTVEADEFVKNNGFLYEGWYFEIPQPEGSRLFDSGL